MNPKRDARIALCKCKEGKKTYGVRFEKSEDGWKYTWAFKIKETSALLGGYRCLKYHRCTHRGRSVFIIQQESPVCNIKNRRYLYVREDHYQCTPSYESQFGERATRTVAKCFVH